MGFPDVSSFPCPSPYRGCGGWQFGNQMHHLMRPFHSSIINITEGSIFRPLGKIFLEKFLGVPQGSAQLLSGKEPALRAFLPVHCHSKHKQRILVLVDCVTLAGKYQSAGKPPFGSQVSKEYQFAAGPRTPLRHFVALFP